MVVVGRGLDSASFDGKDTATIVNIGMWIEVDGNHYVAAADRGDATAIIERGNGVEVLRAAIGAAFD